MQPILVPDDYTTISEAVSVAAENDTIIVSAGVYNEIITIPSDKPNLTILGAQANIPGLCTSVRMVD